jgi:hypothetical protein
MSSVRAEARIIKRELREYGKKSDPRISPSLHPPYINRPAESLQDIRPSGSFDRPLTSFDDPRA